MTAPTRKAACNPPTPLQQPGRETGAHEDIALQRSNSEADLIAQAQDGGSDAFGELYQLHLDAIYRYIYSRVGETAEAENLSQTVFIKAWQALGRYKPSNVPFRAWLYRIAHNTVVDHYRTRKNGAALIEHDVGEFQISSNGHNPEEIVISQERAAHLRLAITKLKPNYQQVLTLRFLNGLDYPETAEILDRNVNAVRVLQFRALQALQKTLAKEAAQSHTTVRQS